MLSARVEERRRFLEDSIVVWFQNLETVQDQSVTEHLQRIAHAVHFFTDWQTMIDFIQEIHLERIFLILADDIDEDLLKSAHNLNQIVSIHIHNTMQSVNLAGLKKVRGTFDSLEELCESVLRIKRITEHDQTTINTSTLDPQTLDPSFVYSQLLKGVLIDLPYDQKARDSLAVFIKANYQDDRRTQQLIDEFQEDTQHSPVWWYTRDSFLYPMLNRALRIQDVDLLHKLGFFIRDLHDQLQQLHLQSPLQAPMTLYRGQGLTRDDFDRIQSTPNGIISFNQFLSTSRDEAVAHARAESTAESTDCVGILFFMTIDPRVSPAPFASIDGESYFGSSEAEVLFSLNTIFRIGAVERLQSNLFRIELTLIQDGDQQMRKLTQYLQTEIEVNEDPLGRFGQLALRMGEWAKAKEIYEIKLNEAMISQNTQNMAHTHHQMGYIYQQLGDCKMALQYLRRSLDIYIRNGRPSKAELANTYSMIGIVLLEQGTNLQAAVYNLQYALESRKNEFNTDRQSLAKNYCNLGSALSSLQRHDEALVNMHDALKIQLRFLPHFHMDLASTYSRISHVYYDLEDYETAIIYCEKSLRVYEHCRRRNSPDLAVVHTNMASNLGHLKRFEEGIQHAEKAIEISKSCLSPHHKAFKERHQILRALRNELVRSQNPTTNSEDV